MHDAAHCSLICSDVQPGGGPPAASASARLRPRRSRRRVRILPAIAVVVLQLSPAQPLLAAGRRPSAAQAAVPASADRYRLGPGDGLQLRFLDPGATELGGALTLLGDGTATMALLGSVDLAGLTLNQAQQLLQRLYARYLRRPELILAVVTPRPLRVTVSGEVERPGVYELPPTTATTVMAIQAAGGATLQADLQSVLLQRPSGQAAQTTLDLAALLRQGDQRQNPQLLDGDTLQVGRLAAGAVTDPQVLELAVTNLRPQTIRVNVIGEVRAPGRLELPAGTAMVEAVLAAGGAVPWRGRTSQAELVRVNRDGTTRREVIALHADNKLTAAFNPPLQNNDTVIVRRTLYAKSLDVLNQVLVPLGVAGNFFWLYRAFWP